MDADDSSDDEVLAMGPESENNDENNDEIMIPETVYTRSGRKAGGFSTVSDLFRGKSSDAILFFLTHDTSLCVNCSTCCLLIKSVVLCRQLNKIG